MWLRTQYCLRHSSSSGTHMSSLTHNPQNYWLRGPEATETRRLGWEHEDRLSSTSSLTAMIHHRNSSPAQPLPQHLLIPQTLGTCSVLYAQAGQCRGQKIDHDRPGSALQGLPVQGKRQADGITQSGQGWDRRAHGAMRALTQS